MNGRVQLNTHYLVLSRRDLGFSQEKLANYCRSKNILISLASIKRAETGKPVLYRTAGEFAKLYNVTINEIIIQICLVTTYKDLSDKMIKSC